MSEGYNITNIIRSVKATTKKLEDFDVLVSNPEKTKTFLEEITSKVKKIEEMLEEFNTDSGSNPSNFWGDGERVGKFQPFSVQEVGYMVGKRVELYNVIEKRVVRLYDPLGEEDVEVVVMQVNDPRDKIAVRCEND